MYVGEQLSADYCNVLFGQFSRLRFLGPSCIIDRIEVGQDEKGIVRYKYRLDVGNTLIELWVVDSLLAF